MPLQNRVTPLGELIADPARGHVFGNRGRLHDSAGRIRRAYDGERWIACRLEFRGRHRDPMPPGRYTGLFFLDEATAFAAGHRPCAECRHEDYVRFVAIWSRLHPGESRAGAIDSRLHRERLQVSRRSAAVRGLPDGAFVMQDGQPFVVLHSQVLRWTPSGYGPPAAPQKTATILTPPSLLALLEAGWLSCLPLVAVGGGFKPSATLLGQTTHT